VPAAFRTTRSGLKSSTVIPPTGETGTGLDALTLEAPEVAASAEVPAPAVGEGVSGALGLVPQATMEAAETASSELNNMLRIRNLLPSKSRFLRRFRLLGCDKDKVIASASQS
jgi:hypothetical protein